MSVVRRRDGARDRLYRAGTALLTLVSLSGVVGAVVAAGPASPASAATSGYSATITASGSSPAVGQPVTLTATANQNVWPTPYGLSIFDATTGAVIAHTGGSSSSSADTVLTTTVSQTTAGTQQYEARIDNSAGTAIAFVSGPVAVTWTAPSSSGTGGTTSPTPTPTPSPTPTPNPTPAPTPAPVPVVSAVTPGYGPSGGGTSVTVTGSGFTGATGVLFGSSPATSVRVVSDSSITATAPSGTTTVAVTVTAPGGTSAAVPAGDYTYTYANGGYSATITASGGSPAVGQSVTLTATANQNVWPTPYGLSIFDATTGAVIAHTGGSSSSSADTVLTATVSQTTAGTQQYEARIDNSAGTAFAAVSDPVTVTWTAAGSSSGTGGGTGGTGGTGTSPAPVASAVIQEAQGFPVSNEADSLSTLTVDPARAGDLLVLSVQEHLTSFGVASVSGGGVGLWQRAVRYSDPDRPLTYEIWYGTVTSPGPTTVTVGYRSYSPWLPIEMIADSFSVGTNGSWSTVTNGGTADPDSAMVLWPSLTAGTSALQLYWGASEEGSSGYPGSTPGFVYTDTANWNTMTYDMQLAPGQTYAPESVVSPAAAWTATAAIFSFS